MDPDVRERFDRLLMDLNIYQLTELLAIASKAAEGNTEENAADILESVQSAVNYRERLRLKKTERIDRKGDNSSGYFLPYPPV